MAMSISFWGIRMAAPNTFACHSFQSSRVLRSRSEYVDAKDLQFPLWNSYAGVPRCNPKLYPVINAYCDALPRQDIQSCFLYNYSLYQWEIAMHTNMGGGLPAIGFWEMKQDICETFRV